MASEKVSTILFDGENCDLWGTCAQANLSALGLWEYVDGTEEIPVELVGQGITRTELHQFVECHQKYRRGIVKAVGTIKTILNILMRYGDPNKVQ